MSLGPHDPNKGTPREGEDFDWLYGEHASGTVDDATRVMPTIPRPARPGAPASRTTPRPAGPILPPRTGGGAGGGYPRTRVRWKRVVLLFVVLPLVAWLAFLITVPVLSWSKFDRVNAFPAGARPAEGQGANYLLVGSDSRRGLTREQMKMLGVGGVAVGPGRTDTIMILHLGSGPATLLSIPRDSWVHIPGYGVGKINSAYAYGGARLLVQTVEQNTGLRIDHFVAIGLGGFVQAVDAVGGVEICPTSNVNDWRADLHIKKGCQTADGATALAWSRSRHAFALGDIAREQHQRQIVHEVGGKVKSFWTFALPWRYLAINNAAVTGLTIDNKMTLFNMISFAQGLSGVQKTCAMPIADLSVDWDTSRVRELMKYFENDDTAHIPARLCTPTGLPQ